MANMTADEKKIARTIENALVGLSDEKKQFFLGYAEGMAAMAGLLKDKPAA